MSKSASRTTKVAAATAAAVATRAKPTQRVDSSSDSEPEPDSNSDLNLDSNAESASTIAAKDTWTAIVHEYKRRDEIVSAGAASAPTRLIKPVYSTGDASDLLIRPYGEYFADDYRWSSISKLVGAVIQLLTMNFDLAIKVIEMRSTINKSYTGPSQPHRFEESKFQHEILDAPTVLVALLAAPELWRKLILTRLGSNCDIDLSGPNQLAFRYWAVVTTSTGAYDTFSTSIDAPCTYSQAASYSLNGWGSIFNFDPILSHSYNTVRASDLVNDKKLQKSVRLAERSSELREECGLAVKDAVRLHVAELRAIWGKEHTDAQKKKKKKKEQKQEREREQEQEQEQEDEEDVVPVSPYALPRK
jgi:hypothetical protein